MTGFSCQSEASGVNDGTMPGGRYAFSGCVIGGTPCQIETACCILLGVLYLIEACVAIGAAKLGG